MNDLAHPATPHAGTATPDPNEDKLAKQAARVSVLVSILLLSLKFWAYRITHSQAVLSDAMETIANVVASMLALIVLAYAYKPADRDHPYGHGKVEFFSAAFEGGLIAFASIMICVGAIQTLLRGSEVHELGWGLALTVIGGVINAALGFYLLRAGRRHHSATLLASGQHVISDFWTSAGVVVGLLLVQLTGLRWLDAVAALVVGLALGWTGIQLVRRSASGLLDEEDREILERLLVLMGRERPTGIIQVHHVRVMRSGRYHHIDAHAVVPEFWNVEQAHLRTENFETQIMTEYPFPGELHLHVDPCRRAYCRFCDEPNCPIRRQPFEKRLKLSLDEFTSPNEPKQFSLN